MTFDFYVLLLDFEIGLPSAFCLPPSAFCLLVYYSESINTKYDDPQRLVGMEPCGWLVMTI